MIGKKIKELRKSKGLNQTEFAKPLFVTAGAVSQWEKGLTWPDTSRLLTISKVYGVPLDYFNDESEEPKEKDQEDDDTWAIRERLRRDPDMRMLFSAADKATPEHLRAAAAMLKALEPPTFPDDEPQEFPE